MVAGEAFQDVLGIQPVLEELGWQLDEITLDAGAGERTVRDIGQQTVQAVPELVKERMGVVERQQRGFAGFGLGESS